MSPSEFEFLINLIGEKIFKKNTAFRKAISVHNLIGEKIFKKNTAFRKAISVQERLAPTCFDKFYDTSLSPLHITVTKTLKKPHNTTDSHHS